MKTLALIVTLLASMNSFAETDPSPFETCTAGDMNLLRAATALGNQPLNAFIKEEVIEKNTSCVVSKPRFFHPAVCGTSITQIDTFIINVENASYTVIVDSSYRSCLRIRRIPVVKKFSYESIPPVVRFP